MKDNIGRRKRNLGRNKEIDERKSLRKTGGRKEQDTHLLFGVNDLGLQVCRNDSPPERKQRFISTRRYAAVLQCGLGLLAYGCCTSHRC